jgi:putative Ca2+/H+ antiporter (TMEM165/GDT1 family)
MEAFLVSAGLVAVAEIGDKTQLLAILLAARFRKPVPIILGILVATLANHALAATVGALAGEVLKGPWMRWGLGIAFLGFAAWALIPDKFDESEQKSSAAKTAVAVFWATTVSFFFVEMGDKTQVATAALAARFGSIALVAAGTTLGMLIANVPAVLIGEAAAAKLPLKYIRWAAAASFAVIGVWVLVAG